MNTLLFIAVIFAIAGTVVSDRKRCFCKVVASDNSNNVIHDFGAITEHKNWLSVGCRRLHKCPDECDRKVKEWVCSNQAQCRAKVGNKKVVPFYKASVCGSNAGNNERSCGCVGGPFNDIPKCQFKCFSESTTIANFITCFNKCLTG